MLTSCVKAHDEPRALEVLDELRAVLGLADVAALEVVPAESERKR